MMKNLADVDDVFFDSSLNILRNGKHSRNVDYTFYTENFRIQFNHDSLTTKYKWVCAKTGPEIPGGTL